MTGCCSFPNLGCLQIPTNTTTITGPPGPGGGTGYRADMARVSTTSNTLGLGTQTFTYTVTSPNIGWAVGTRLRAYNSSTDYMEGFVTAVSGTSVTFTSDLVVGSGTFASWDIVIAGDQGSAGAAGLPGTVNIISDSTTNSVPALVTTLIKTGTIPADALTTVGDALVVKIGLKRISVINATQRDDSYKVEINGQKFFYGYAGNGFVWIPSPADVFFDVRINYLTNTTARCQVSTSGTGLSQGGSPTIFGATYTQTTDLTGLDFSSNQDIEVFSKQANANNISCTGLYADLIKAI
tara:strand:+ start:85 stop:969 length:885 start_codon:yes stop_codon:yes gene_type:complete